MDTKAFFLGTTFAFGAGRAFAYGLGRRLWSSLHRSAHDQVQVNPLPRILLMLGIWGLLAGRIETFKPWLFLSTLAFRLTFMPGLAVGIQHRDLYQ